jgi:hypothetical protein
MISALRCGIGNAEPGMHLPRTSKMICVVAVGPAVQEEHTTGEGRYRQRQGLEESLGSRSWIACRGACGGTMPERHWYGRPGRNSPISQAGATRSWMSRESTAGI